MEAVLNHVSNVQVTTVLRLYKQRETKQKLVQ